MTRELPEGIVEEEDPRNAVVKPGRARPVTVNYQGEVAIRQPVGYRRRVKEVASKFWIHERRRQAYTLANGNFSTERIGYHLHADPEFNTNKKMPGGQQGGYGWWQYARGEPALTGERLRAAVRRDMDEGLRLSAKYEARSREEYIRRELDGLNDAQAAIWSKVLDGNLRAVEQYVSIQTRRSKILGLDQPDRVESTHAHVHVHGVMPTIDQGYVDKMVEAWKQMGALVERPEGAPAASTGDFIDVSADEAPPE